MKTIVAIHFAEGCYRLVQLSQRSAGIRVDQAATRELNDPVFPDIDQEFSFAHDLRRTITENGFNPKAAAVVDLPGASVFYATLETDVTRKEDIQRLLKYELEDEVPIPFEDLAADLSGHHRVGDKIHCFVASARRSEIRSLCDQLDEAGVSYAAVTTDVNAVAALALCSSEMMIDQCTVVVHVETTRLVIAILDKGSIIGGRSLAFTEDSIERVDRVISELELTSRVYSSYLQAEGSCALLSASEGTAPDYAEAIESRLGLPVSLLDIKAAIPVPGEYGAEPDFRIALGLGLRHLKLGGSSPNLITSELSEASLKKDAWRAGRICAVLVMLLLVLLGARTVTSIRALDLRNAELKAEIKRVFSEGLPEVTKIVQPLPQMVEQLDLARKEHGILADVMDRRALPLHIIQTVSQRCTSARELTVSYMAIDRDAVNITGTGGSFEAVESLVADLRAAPEFENVDIENVSANRGGGRVQFKLSLERAL